jgi:transposase
MSDEKFTILTAGLHLLTDELQSWGIEKGHTTHRMVGAARKQLVMKLHGEGLSQRQIAALVGVGHRTVGRDINEANGSDDPNDPENDPEAEQEGDTHDLEECDAPSRTSELEERWRYNLSLMAGYSIDLPEYWEKHFKGWQNVNLTSNDVELVRKAIMAWKIIEERMKEWVN